MHKKDAEGGALPDPSQQQIEEAILRVVQNNRAELLKRMAPDNVLVLALLIQVIWVQQHGHRFRIYDNKFTMLDEEGVNSLAADDKSEAVIEHGLGEDLNRAYFTCPIPGLTWSVPFDGKALPVMVGENRDGVYIERFIGVVEGVDTDQPILLDAPRNYPDQKVSVTNA